MPDRDASASARSATRRGGAARASGCVFRLRLPAAAAAGPLAVICVLDTVGTVASGWFTDRVDARVLLDVAVRTAEPAAA